MDAKPVTMDSGAAGHVMIEGMFPRVKLERKIAPNKFVAVIGEQSETCARRPSHSRKVRGVRVLSDLFISMQKAVRLKNILWC